MYLLIVFLPLLSSCLVGLGGSYLSTKGAIYVSLMSIFVTALCSLLIFYEVVICQSIVSFKLFTWIESNVFKISWGFLFDNLTATMLVVVTVISSLVHLYSTDYMKTDPHLPRFLSYLSFFTFFMLMLVTADNFIQMFLGWEGVGVASYLLINFWYTRIQANKSAMKAIILNRIGDFGLSIGIASVFFVFQTVDFPTVFALTPFFANENYIIAGYTVNKITAISLFIFIGAVGKSAQIGLHTWLPDAMEGPTPVSALIHAATMVTAGVFVLLRCSPLIDYSDNALLIITIVGVLTALMAATIGVVQNDLKKVIAYSTCSQLGYMVFSIGLSNYSVSLFHLMNHAFFKALLFLSAGSVIHALNNEQDMRKMGGMLRIIPVTYLMIFIGSLSLMGFPFLTGFYSKDILLELTYGGYTTTGMFAYWLGTLSAFFTSFYSLRLIYFTFFGRNNSSLFLAQNAHESSWTLLTPLFILAVGSVFWGFLGKELFLGGNVQTWNSTFLVLPWHNFQFDSEFLPFYVKLIPVGFSLGGAFSSFLIYFSGQSLLNQLSTYKHFYPYYHFLSKKWYFDDFYNKIIAKNILSFGYHTSFKTIDRGVVEWFGPFGITQLLRTLSIKTGQLQTGLVYNYVLSMVLGVTFFLLLLFLPIYFTAVLLFVYLYIFICLCFYQK